MGSCANSDRKNAVDCNVRVSSTYSCIRNINIESGDFKTTFAITIKEDNNILWKKEYDVNKTGC